MSYGIKLTNQDSIVVIDSVFPMYNLVRTFLWNDTVADAINGNGNRSLVLSDQEEAPLVFVKHANTADGIYSLVPPRVEFNSNTGEVKLDFYYNRKYESNTANQSGMENYGGPSPPMKVYIFGRTSVYRDGTNGSVVVPVSTYGLRITDSSNNESSIAGADNTYLSTPLSIRESHGMNFNHRQDREVPGNNGFYTKLLSTPVARAAVCILPDPAFVIRNSLAVYKASAQGSTPYVDYDNMQLDTGGILRSFAGASNTSGITPGSFADALYNSDIPKQVLVIDTYNYED
jgi:hypothetical protein